MTYLPTRRIFFVALALTLLLLGGLAACAQQPTQPTALPATPPPPTPTPLPRGGTLSIRASADLPDLKPWQPRSRAEEQAIQLLYSGLTHLDNKLVPRPDLAERWDISADGRLITFTLRSNLTWHDGVPVSAEDVAYTLGALREITPTTALLADLRNRITTATVLATNTIELSLTERYAPIMADLAVPILPRHLLNGRDLSTLNFWDAPTGSGPFKLETRAPGQSITLAANSLFYRGPPLLDRVTLVVAPDAALASQALADGRLLLAELPPTQPPPPNAQRGEYAENGSFFLAFNTRAGRVFEDPALRNALAAAVDIPALVQQATAGAGTPIGHGAALGSWADFTPPPTSPTSTVELDRARALLDAAGWRAGEAGLRQRDGRSLAAQILVRGDDPRRVKAAEFIAKAVATIGISLTVQPTDFTSQIQPRYLPPYDFDLLMGSWVGGAGDPQFADYLFYDPDDYALFHSSQINQGVADARAVLNFVGFNDPAYETQAVVARQLYDTEQRSQSIRRTQQRLSDMKPYLYLWSDRVQTALSPSVATLDGPVDLKSPLYLWNIERWYIVR
ncbi:MAG: peptide ABC transporter substrate-binding protein [Roseiflexaceae bacterium]|nr:peptide ABC transporter substrate-binding protein [Roseiflexaceae bacterium]